MASNSFKEQLQKMGYDNVLYQGNEILVEKKEEVASILITFSNSEKTLFGAVKANKMISTLDEVSRIYSLFNQMKEDLKTFNKLSNYDILN